MKKFISLIFLLMIYSTAHADCNDAFKRCRNECNSIGTLYNYENGNLLNSLDTDFVSNCENSCRRGKRYCEGESNRSDGCYEFKRKCRNECPSSVISFSTGNILLLTDANSKCEDACYSGYRRCE
jgi:hypothetical protein